MNLFILVLFSVTTCLCRNIMNVTFNSDTNNAMTTIKQLVGVNKPDKSISDSGDASEVIASDHKIEPNSCYGNKTISDCLFHKIVEGIYDDTISNKTDQHCFKNYAIQQMFDSKANDIMEYAYQLWIAGEKEFVSKNFPPAFEALLNGDEFGIISNDFKTGISFSGNSSTEYTNKPIIGYPEALRWRSIWKTIPIWDNDRIYFKFYNVHANLYLGVNPYELEDGDYGVWGESESESHTEAHHWYLKIMGYNIFKIVNRKHNLTLSFHDNISVNNEIAVIWASNEQLCINNQKTFPWYDVWSIVPLELVLCCSDSPPIAGFPPYNCLKRATRP